MRNHKMIPVIEDLLADSYVDYEYTAYIGCEEVRLDNLRELPQMMILVGEEVADVFIVKGDNVVFDLCIDCKMRNIKLYVGVNGDFSRLATYPELAYHLDVCNECMPDLLSLHVIAKHISKMVDQMYDEGNIIDVLKSRH